MRRREFIKMLCAAGISAPFAPYWLRSAEAATAPYDGDLLLFINTQGGWDPVQFCDPKGNLNRGFGDADIQTAGGLRYAPLSSNGQPYALDFFETFHEQMIVVQGINMQTNAHGPGVINAFQGTFASGFPTLSAALAGVRAPSLPMSYMVTGNYRSSGDLLPYTAISQASLISSLSRPNYSNNLGRNRIPEDIFAMADAARRARIDRMLVDDTLMPRRRRMLEYFSGAVDGSLAVENLGNILPEGGFQVLDEHGVDNDLVKQGDVILHAMAAGLTLAADAEFVDNPFDSHADHAAQQGRLLARLVYGVRFIWNRAMELDDRTGNPISNRLVLVITSDFGRTPSINSDSGTDHWPTSSAIVMRKSFANDGLGSRTISYSSNDGRYQSGRIDPVTLAVDETNGIELTSAHFHLAMRNHFGIADAQALAHVGFPGVDPVNIFNPAYATPQI